jgi:hypothetical protein
VLVQLDELHVLAKALLHESQGLSGRHAGGTIDVGNVNVEPVEMLERCEEWLDLLRHPPALLGKAATLSAVKAEEKPVDHRAIIDRVRQNFLASAAKRSGRLALLVVRAAAGKARGRALGAEPPPLELRLDCRVSGQQSPPV